MNRTSRLLPVLFGIALIAAGCGSEHQAAAGESGMIPDALSTTSSTLKPNDNSEVPAFSTPIPSATSNPTAPILPTGDSSEAQPERDVVNEDPGKAAALADDVLIRFERTGGFAGVEEQWSIFADGRVVSRDGQQGAVALAKIEKLVETIGGAGFFEMEESYIPLNSCCDRFSYAITVQHDGVVKTVHTIDAAPKQPAQLIEVIDAISALIATVD